MMDSLTKMNQKMLFPTVPPCISININRFNEISLNIYNNNPIQKPEETIPEKPSMIEPVDQEKPSTILNE